ncbi:DMT family transporter [Aquibium sp. A9E412]|uniref:DMT family transporter n=1 Tax=Aquibium sp. A9E412 TaxID=2976767 RepID=UPI0025AF641F|nr:DMT family transporter [Aquibium sp. A9E412]MDN2566790.1 DMT family transporter [Aquibium sp. A9E412]
MTSLSPTVAGHLAQLLSITVWTSGLIVQKTLTPAASVGSILLVQLAGAAAVLWLALALAGRLPALTRRNLVNVAWGLLAPGLVLIFGLAGAARTDGVSVSMIWGLVPLVGPVLARLILREPLHWSFPVGGLVGLLGLIVITLDRQRLGASDMAGNLLVFAGVLCASISHVIGRFLNTGTVPWYQTATLQVTGAALAAGVLAALTGWRLPASADPATLAGFLYVVFVMTVVNFLAFNFALGRIQAAWVSLYVSLAPAIGTLAAVVLLGSVVRPADALGIAIIVAGIAFPHLMRLTPGGRAHAAAASAAAPQHRRPPRR